MKTSIIQQFHVQTQPVSSPAAAVHRSTLCLVLMATLATVGITGCATRSNSGAVYSSGQTQREQVVRLGVVESVRPVTIENRGEGGVGTLAGAVVGGVAGSSIGGGKGSVVGAVLGAVAGGVAGQAIENSAQRQNGVEITVRLENGELRAIVQTADEPFQPGERVRILSSGGSSRVTH
jgi:outer membrane lipoprotein SlyB